MSNAWADLLDARARLVHEWVAEGLGLDEMLDRLNVDHDALVAIVLKSPDPPPPGTSRDRLRLWRLRTEELEKELHEVVSAAPVRVPSHIRDLLSDADPARCICQGWSDHALVPMRKAGQHHPECRYHSGP